MVQRYVRPTVEGWLVPTLFAPWLSAFVFVTASVAWRFDRGLLQVGSWALGMLLACAWTFAYCVVLVLTDAALLAVKVRTLPVGRRGWLASFGSPFAVFATYAVLPPYRFYAAGAWTVCAAIVLPMVAAALASRLLCGERPPR
jgi:hypothetical protein